MKNFTPALINTDKPKFGLKSLFFGNASAKNNFYSARHKTEDIYLLWIESNRFGNTHCFPCVLEEQGDPMIYFSGRSSAAANNALVQRWGLFAIPATFSQDFEWREMPAEDFYEQYNGYKNRSREKDAPADPPEQAE